MQKIRIDFDNPGLPQHISAVENDSQSRFFQATLYENGKAYTAPEGATYSIMYRGFGPQNQGWYDTINDGAGKRAACVVSGNVVTCEIARQTLQVPGHVSIVLCVTTGKGYMHKSWPIECDCKNDRYDSTVEIQSFFYVTQISNESWTQAIQAVEELKNTIDPTLSLSGKAADAAKVGEAVNAEAERAKGVESQIKEDIDDGNVATKVIKPINLYNKDTVTRGGYINNTGTITGNDQFTYSDFIEIDKTKKYATETVFGINMLGALYGASNNFLDVVYNSNVENNVLDLTSFASNAYYNNIKTIRLNRTLNDIVTFMFVEGTKYPEEYIPYTETKYEVIGNLRKGVDELFANFGLKLNYFVINEALNNIAFGKNAMKNASTDNGAYNVAIGDEALVNNTGTGSDDTGNYNVAIGYKAMQANTTGNHNTAVGFQAMPVNTTGVGNTAIGEDACLSNTTGNGNTGIGRYSLFSNKEGGNNVAIGLHSLRNCLGNRNTAIGQSSGVSCKGNNNIFLGYYSNSRENVENSIVIGNENYCHESNMMDVGSGYIEKVVLSTKTGKKLIVFNEDGTVTWSKYTAPSN